MATALEEDDARRAWALTRAVEEAAGTVDDGVQPPGPVIGRRFAKAHRRPLDSAGAAPSAAGLPHQPSRARISRDVTGTSAADAPCPPPRRDAPRSSMMFPLSQPGHGERLLILSMPPPGVANHAQGVGLAFDCICSGTGVWRSGAKGATAELMWRHNGGALSRTDTATPHAHSRPSQAPTSQTTQRSAWLREEAS